MEASSTMETNELETIGDQVSWGDLVTESGGHPVVETLSSALAQMPGWFARHMTPERPSGRDQNMVMMNFECMVTKFDELQQDIILLTSASSTPAWNSNIPPTYQVHSLWLVLFWKHADRI